jgi:glycosyltransferase involved in cell wall biosynthesis
MHAAKIAQIWTEAGIDITMRTSYAQGQPPAGTRDGYSIIRKSGRYSVFPHTIVSEMLGSHGPRDALVEIWNGVPFLSPIWFRGPKVVVLHHVHRDMWEQVLSPKLATFGKVLEGQLAPPFYKRTQIVTISNSSRDEITGILRLPQKNITVAPPGIDPRFVPGVPKSVHPLIVTVGRLMPPKRFDEMIRIANEVRKVHTDLELVVAGDGYERPKLQELIDDLDANDWVRLPGHVSDNELVWLYQQAWCVTSASSAEGWGMTLTEAAACGTPAVATRIPGHKDSVDDDVSGLLTDSPRDMVEKISRIIEDRNLRTRLSEGALKHAAAFSWESCALSTFEPLAREAIRTRAPSGGTH